MVVLHMPLQSLQLQEQQMALAVRYAQPSATSAPHEMLQCFDGSSN